MRRRGRQWLGYLILVAGLCVLTSPFLTGWSDGRKQARVVEEFEAGLSPVEEDPEAASSTEDAVDAAPTHFENEEMGAADAFLAAARAYNDQLFQSRQNKLISTKATETFALDARDYGRDENLVGTIWIPRMDVELGLYLGANNENMAKGAAIFGETSIPLGRANENTAVAGHRGWRGTPMFRDIQRLRVGDEVIVSTAWATLFYRVRELLIVTPEDNDWCRIEDGRSLVSLMTCHPYTKHYQRYVAIAELSETEPVGTLVTEAAKDERREMVTPETDAPNLVTEVSADGDVHKVQVLPEAIDPDGTEYGSVWSNVMILAEDQMKVLAVVLTGLVALLGVGLLGVTINDRKRGAKDGESGAGDSGSHR